MDAGTQAQLLNEIRAVTKSDTKEGADGAEESEIRGLGSHQLLLRVYNILAWEGPDFVDENGRPIPCNRVNILRMDPTSELWELVGAKIGELNKKIEKPSDADPN